MKDMKKNSMTLYDPLQDFVQHKEHFKFHPLQVVDPQLEVDENFKIYFSTLRVNSFKIRRKKIMKMTHFFHLCV